MTPSVLLALIADLYQQILELRAENQALRAGDATDDDIATPTG